MAASLGADCGRPSLLCANRQANLTVARVEISFEGGVVAGRHGDARTYCTVSFPGAYKAQWDALVAAAAGGGLSTACVFVITGDPRAGKHCPNPDTPGKCHCHSIYGFEAPWGCVWRAAAPASRLQPSVAAAALSSAVAAARLP